ncbi:hypothetical protein [uncultured Modestobacter sp.]|uniref:hypothetical protein n=1 Tax=uncultured Modestobacter sp. TaxID=380048 RepID=UPI0026059AF2|nr:hypothetical protein [uncultured Modestobacter sp.]
MQRGREVLPAAVGVDLAAPVLALARCRLDGSPTVVAAPGAECSPAALARVGDPVPVWTVDGPVPAADLVAVRLVAALDAALPDGRPADVAVAVPAHWADHRRGSLATALDAAGLPAPRLFGRPLAVVAQLTFDELLHPPADVVVVELGDRETSAARVRLADGAVAPVGLPSAPVPWGARDAEDALLALALAQLPVPEGALDEPTARALRLDCRAAAEELATSPAAGLAVGADRVRLLRSEWADALAGPLAAVLGGLPEVRAARREGHTAVVLTGWGAGLPGAVEVVSEAADVVPVVPADPRTVAARGAALLAAAAAERPRPEAVAPSDEARPGRRGGRRAGRGAVGPGEPRQAAASTVVPASGGAA